MVDNATINSNPDSSADIEQKRVHDTLELIRTLITSLPEKERDRFILEQSATIRSLAAPRAGDVLGTIVRLLPQKKNWTVSELKRGIDERGIRASPKEIYNALGYLTRKGHIQRIGYGRYLIDGIPVVTADALGGQPSITEGDLDD